MTRRIAAALLALVAVTGLAAPALADPSAVLPPQRADVAGTSIAYAELGAGEPLLLLNGTASPMNEWDPALLTALAADHRVIVLDYPGLGLSGPAPGSWTFAHAADWIAAFVDDVVPEGRVDLLGWSMGGFIAQQLAQRHPEQVDHLVLAATNPGGDAAVLGPRWVQEADSHGGEAAYLRSNYPVGHRDAGRRFLARLDEAVSSGVYPEEEVPAQTVDQMVAAEDPWLRSDANLRGLARVSAPTLVITGAEDAITPPVNSRRIAQALPDSRLVLVPGAGHSFLFQAPRRAARMIEEFLVS